MSGSIFQIYVDEITLRRLKATATELDRDVTELAESAVSEAALDHWRGRNDDPAKEPKDFT